MFPAHCVDYLQSDVYVIPDKHKIKTEPKFIKQLGFPCSSVSKESDYNAGDLGSPLGWEDPLEKEMVTHSSILVWRIPRTEKPGRLQSMGLQET